MRKPDRGDLVEAEAAWIGERLTRPPLWRRIVLLLFPPVNLVEAVCCAVPAVGLVAVYIGHPKVSLDAMAVFLLSVVVVSSWGLWRISAIGWRRWALARWQWLAVRLVAAIHRRFMP